MEPIHEDNERGRIYEIGAQINPTLGDEGVQERFAQLKARIVELGGEIIQEGEPERMDLAYPISQVRENKKTIYHEAYFAWVKFELDASRIKGLEEELSNDLSIIRYLAFKTVRANTYIPRKHPRKSTERPEEVIISDEDLEDDDDIDPLDMVDLGDDDDDMDEETESILDKKLDELTSDDVE